MGTRSERTRKHIAGAPACEGVPDKRLQQTRAKDGRPWEPEFGNKSWRVTFYWPRSTHGCWTNGKKKITFTKITDTKCQECSTPNNKRNNQQGEHVNCKVRYSFRSPFSPTLFIIIIIIIIIIINLTLRSVIPWVTSFFFPHSLSLLPLLGVA